MDAISFFLFIGGVGFIGLMWLYMNLSNSKDDLNKSNNQQSETKIIKPVLPTKEEVKFATENGTI